MASRSDYRAEIADLIWLDGQGLPTSVLLAYIGRRCNSLAARDATFDRERFLGDVLGGLDTKLDSY